jgi:cytochrome c peroxidase
MLRHDQKGTCLMTHCSSRFHGPGLGAAIAMCSLLACTTSNDESAAQATQDLSGLDGLSLRHVVLANPFGLHPLADEPIPQPTHGHIIDRAAAIRLGKTFFWDIQAGSDGKVACAVCHASFGSDARRLNTLNPGADGIFASGGVTGPDQVYTPALITNDDVVGVQGVARRTFVSINPDPAIADENCTAIDDPLFHLSRRVEFRQAPMIYGAALLRELFWAGEANEQFNGLSIWGFTGNNIVGEIDHQDNAALASQSVGPPGNSTEMRCTGRPMNGATNSMGAKMLARPPLQFQRVSPTDSVLGALANRGGPGLMCNGAPCTYRSLIAAAFGADTAANAENVFSLIWGESIQAYEMTLIPDRTPLDRFLGGRITALTPRQIIGLATFVGRGNCVVCHAGPMLSDATVAFFQTNGALNRDGGDQGFHNIGLVNTQTDGGRGVAGVGGAPLSQSGSQFDDWSFKTPTLRNVGLTGPYFHSGSNPTLDDVVEFYNRGGDADNPQKSADIKPLNLLSFEKRALVDFLANALTDCRVLKQRAPFDHPELPVPNGTNLAAVGARGTGSCDDDDDHHDHDD